MKKIIGFIVAACLSAAAATSLAACSPHTQERTQYRITAAYDGGNTLSGEVEVSYFNSTDNALDSLCFNLWGNGVEGGSMEITSLSGGEWEADGTALTVSLASTLYPEERAEVTIAYTLTLAEGNARTAVTEHTVNLGNFYPVLCAYDREGWLSYDYAGVGDPFVSEVADYTVELTVPEGYAVAASAVAGGTETADGMTTHFYELGGARDFCAVLSTEFEIATCEADGTDVYYYYYDDENAENTLNVAAESLEFFDKTFGGYPYPAYTLVQTGLDAGGMEYPALAMISDKCDEQTAVYTTVHETAHQWWYAVVGSNSYTSPWQDEGLCEYSCMLFFENAPQYGFTKVGLLGSATKAYRGYYSVYNQLFEGADTSMTRALDEYAGEYEYANIAYNKGLLLFDAAANAVGQENAVAALRKYFEEYKYSVAPPEGLIACFAAYGDAEGVFNSFLNGEIII